MANSNEYMNDYMQLRYYERRELAILILGGECSWCGYLENLEVDHIYREGRSHELKFAKFWNMAYRDFLAELKVCQLLCQDCHLQKTRTEISEDRQAQERLRVRNA